MGGTGEDRPSGDSSAVGVALGGPEWSTSSEVAADVPSTLRDFTCPVRDLRPEEKSRMPSVAMVKPRLTRDHIGCSDEWSKL